MFEQERHDGAPSWQDISCTRPRARKEHICSICRRCINVGERYTRLVALEDGLFTIIRQHEFACWEVS